MSRLPGISVATELGSDDWYTPPHIIEAIGLTYDLDPCAPIGGVPWIPAAKHYTIDDDGLGQPWEGRIWLNPPYSNPYPWVRALWAHGCGVGLIPADTSTIGWHEWVIRADVVCFVKGRITFLRPDHPRGQRAGSIRNPSALIAFGDEEAMAVRQSGLGWCP